MEMKNEEKKNKSMIPCLMFDRDKLKLPLRGMWSIDRLFDHFFVLSWFNSQQYNINVIESRFDMLSATNMVLSILDQFSVCIARWLLIGWMRVGAWLEFEVNIGFGLGFLHWKWNSAPSELVLC